MSFSFDATAGASQSTTKPRLEGNNIYDVVLDGFECQDIVGVKDPTMVYKVIKLKFSNDAGSFEHTVFEPKPEDFKRTSNKIVNKKTGAEEHIPQPSNVESMMLLFKHIIDAFVPEIAAQIDKKEKSLGAKSWDDMRKLIGAILDKGKGRTSKIKLIKDNKGEAKFPGFFAGLTKDFVGEKVAFSAYEVSRINSEATAKVTPASSFTEADLTDNTPETDLDLDFTVAGL
jgi:hypothetical protein